jgi:hypothetical protein
MAGVRFLARARFFSSAQHSDQLYGPPSLLSSGTESDFLGVKWWGHEAHHSPLSSAKTKNGGAIPPLPIYLPGVVVN